MADLPGGAGRRADGRSWLQRWLGHPVEAALLVLFAGLCRALPLDAASALGGRLARTIGPWLPVSGRATESLERCFPDMTPAEIAAVVRGMWDNIGRVVAEYPHLQRLAAADRIEVVGLDRLAAWPAQGVGRLFAAGHLANWEVLVPAARQSGVPLALVYRAPNNPIVDRLLRRARGEAVELLAKGARGARQSIAVLRRGGSLGMLVDQKMNDGIPVPFFGRPAMTAPAVAQLALRYGVPVFPTRVERLGGARFRVTIHPPLVMPDDVDRAAAVGEVMARINDLLESWIRSRPEQWLWLHRRWPD